MPHFRAKLSLIDSHDNKCWRTWWWANLDFVLSIEDRNGCGRLRLIMNITEQSLIKISFELHWRILTEKDLTLKNNDHQKCLYQIRLEMIVRRLDEILTSVLTPTRSGEPRRVPINYKTCQNKKSNKIFKVLLRKESEKLFDIKDRKYDSDYFYCQR